MGCLKSRYLAAVLVVVVVIPAFYNCLLFERKAVQTAVTPLKLNREGRERLDAALLGGLSGNGGSARLALNCSIATYK